ncbi:hypothetical protein TREMEDRAFT_70420 [Tremella mesenterica DSM 1558]|uniref:uncharacterized protein n=1 Tax=Tremella mesenterica (strain ATCC 24925 / CBS 8224 / DSM 1558 / NBRC 9311 / NRRL Y-6157 / RJB 2259-6 / UBC 559-6) TaxID=578456 RepID=UPI00032CBCCE|nr:uncharacterized protein TREMEDRAFT_70420 [Tremella mesenterica DSM 1558]EIW65762.1 hypothetical protein TREMEDRAFT_70420 [Tremella mesenterica DSM 1558]
MGINSPLPVRLPEETKKAAKILRSFVDGQNNGLDKVIPHTVLEKAEGFAIFTVVKAGFLFSARAGSGVVIARTQDGSWSPPSAIGLGGVGFGGQAGAEVTDFVIVLNSKSAVTSFMSAGSLTLGGNLSIAVGPLGRNAEGSGTVSAKGKIAAMYSYSKTKGLFGGVSVEGSVIVERQDANRLAYGGSPSAKQILSGAFDPPDWAQCLIEELQRATGAISGQQWRDMDHEGEGGGMSVIPPGIGNRSRSGSNTGSGYVFGEGIGAMGTGKTRSRSGSLLSNHSERERNPARIRANDYMPRRGSVLNPFSNGSPKKNVVSSSSEQYNAGLTWDSDGPMVPVTRPRGLSSLRNSDRPDDQINVFKDISTSTSKMTSPTFPSNHFNVKTNVNTNVNGSNPKNNPNLGELTSNIGSTPMKGYRNGFSSTESNGDLIGTGSENSEGEKDLLGHWDSNGDGLTTSFDKLSMGLGQRSRSNSRPPLQDLQEDTTDLLGSPNRGKPRMEKERGLSNRGSPSRLTKKVSGRMKEYQETSIEHDPFSLRGIDRNPGITGEWDKDKDGFSSSSPEREGQYDMRNKVLGKDWEMKQDRLFTDLPKNEVGGEDGFARAIALYEFVPTDPGDLGLKQGQKIMVLDKVGQGEWWRGKDDRGKEGIFPVNYVEVVFLPKDLKGGVWRSELRARMADSIFA